MSDLSIDEARKGELMDRLRRKTVMEKASDLVPDECWIWTGSTNGSRRGGYGHIKFGPRDSSPKLIHRVSYELHIGPIPADKQIDHICAVKPCWNPAHLQAVTHQDNLLLHFKRRRGHA